MFSENERNARIEVSKIKTAITNAIPAGCDIVNILVALAEITLTFTALLSKEENKTE